MGDSTGFARMPENLEQGFRLADTVILPHEGTIAGPNGAVHVEPKVMEVLLCLAGESGDVVARATIIDRVWHHTYGSDESLTRCISSLRNYLETAGADPAIIRTVPKRGYAVTVVPESLDATFTGTKAPRVTLRRWHIATAAAVLVVGLATWILLQRPLAVSPPQAPPLAVAVLPFTDLSASGDQQYLGDGIAEALLNTLAQVEGLDVAARTSSFAFKTRNEDVRNIGRFLNVSTVLEGSVNKSGNRIRVYAQLIDAGSGFHLWSKSFNREIDDIFAIQDEVAHSIFSELKKNVLSEARDKPKMPRVADVRAYDRYLAARYNLHQRTPESIFTALKLFEEAITIDPAYAPAYSGLGDALMFLNNYGRLPVASVIARGRPAIEKALALDPELAEAHASLGLFEEDFAGDRDAAEVEYRTAIRLNPGYGPAHMWLGSMLDDSGRSREAEDSYRAALRLDPINPTLVANLARVVATTGRSYDDTMAVYQRLLDAGVADAITYRNLALSERRFGRYDRAVAWARKAVEQGDDPYTLATLAYLYRLLGQFAHAQEWLRKAELAGPENGVVVRDQIELLVAQGERQRAAQFAEAMLAREAALSGDTTTQQYRNAAELAGFAQLRAGNPARAVGLLESAGVGGDRSEVALEPAPDTRGDLILAYQRTGQDAKAIAVLEQARDILAAARKNGMGGADFLYVSARLLALQGDRNEALAELERAYDMGFRYYWKIVVDPAWDALSDEPRFQACIAKIKADIEVMAKRVDDVE